MHVPRLLGENIEVLACPKCGGDLDLAADHHDVVCNGCLHRFTSENGIPLLFWPNDWDTGSDVTEIVKAFYEENPFPGYEDIDSRWRLREKARHGLFARLLDEQIGHGWKALEVGCGTGQLSNFLGTSSGRTVFAADLCLNSLKMGQAFRQKNEINNVAFLQMNLFRPVFKPGVFDLVICNGVLHHTSNPALGFQTISRLVKPGGYILIGLYNTYGRLPTDLRRFLFRISGDRFRFLDPRLRLKNLSESKKQIWFMDQYKHPHESKHSFGEVQRWFEQSGFSFVNSVPKLHAVERFAADERLFEAGPKGTLLDNLLVQLGMLLSGGPEGGFFVMIGQCLPSVADVAQNS